MTTAFSCPFCGEEVAPSLKFCVSCGRPVSPDDVSKVGLAAAHPHRRNGDKTSSKSFKVSKKDYSFQRQSNTWFYSLSMVLVVLIAYYLTMKYVLKEHIPGNIDVMLEQVITPQGQTTK